MSNCSQHNLSADALHVSCAAGYNGGLPQLFTLELFSSADHSVLRNLTLAAPVFTVTHLGSGEAFEARVFASNRLGRSEAVVFTVNTLKRPSEKRLATTSSGGRIA